MSEKEQEQNNVAMVIVAHPDDAEFGAAGTVATWVRDGWDVYYVICTDATGGGPDDATDVGPAAKRRISEIRKREQRAAGVVLGLKDVFFLDYPDGQLYPTIELRRDLVRLLRKYRPSRVVCQSPERTWTPTLTIGRYHSDHLAAGQATLAAIYPMSQNPWDFPELLEKEGLLPHKISEVYIMGAPNVNHFVDISDSMDIKIEALLCHASQFVGRMEEVKDRVRTRSADLGTTYGVAYAEEFHRTENG
ncbi:MAG TPA: PIG-L deacetylase family protein [Ktedonobacteraceae bacterium]|nr:PIG-L deacetylase family protein [Ktedonobacteraceae bacterium]